jgi:hypothetical protein
VQDVGGRLRLPGAGSVTTSEDGEKRGRSSAASGSGPSGPGLTFPQLPTPTADDSGSSRTSSPPSRSLGGLRRAAQAVASLAPRTGLLAALTGTGSGGSRGRRSSAVSAMPAEGTASGDHASVAVLDGPTSAQALQPVYGQGLDLAAGPFARRRVSYDDARMLAKASLSTVPESGPSLSRATSVARTSTCSLPPGPSSNRGEEGSARLERASSCRGASGAAPRRSGNGTGSTPFMRRSRGSLRDGSPDLRRGASSAFGQQSVAEDSADGGFGLPDTPKHG